jgi:hypothetical protein
MIYTIPTSPSIGAPRGAARGGAATGSQPGRQGLGGLRLSRAGPRGPGRMPVKFDVLRMYVMNLL